MLFRRRQDDIPQDNPDRWLLTYADLITLLLAFFVVMYSISRMDAEKFHEMQSALQGVLKGGPSILRNQSLESLEVGHGLMKVGSLKMLQMKIEGEVGRLSQNGHVATELNERGLTIHIMESALFDEGKANLKPRARAILDMVARDIIELPNHVRVEGHTDDRPINNERFPSNWELSTARATEVVRYFVEDYSYPPAKISALGYAQFRPIVPNSSVENRARNRRVDIVVLTMALSAAEPASELNEFAEQQQQMLQGILSEENSADTGIYLPQ